ncbi:protein TALPID3 isoform X2 [Denticeps clupeoides]|nr:protein TALPID3 isoform X2 [Denticeps clupeoides]
MTMNLTLSKTAGFPAKASASHSSAFNDSSASSDAADVLIRSTRAFPPKEGGPDARTHAGSILSPSAAQEQPKVAVKKSRDAPKPSMDEKSKPPSQMLVPIPATYASGTRIKEIDKKCQKPRNKIPENSTLAEQLEGSGNKDSGADLLISKYDTGSKGTVLAALKQRSHGAPVRREVKIKLLDKAAEVLNTEQPVVGPQSAQSTDPQASSGSAPGDSVTASAAAAATAAAIAATVPLMKARSDMESLMSQVAAELRRLQEAGRGQQQGVSGASERVAQLEQELRSLTQQRLQHLEHVQSQQLELQTRLVSSALEGVSGRGPLPAHPIQSSSSSHVATTLPTNKSGQERVLRNELMEGHQGYQRRQTRSPLDTPAPRKVIPLPTHWNKETDKGNGRLREGTLNNQRSPGRSAQSVGVKSVTMATGNREPEQSRVHHPLSEAPHSHTSLTGDLEMGKRIHGSTPGPGADQSLGTIVKKASEMLQDLGRIKSEMQDLLTRDVLPVTSSENGSYPADYAPPAPPPPAAVSMTAPGAAEAALPRPSPLSRPSLLQTSPPPQSMFEDAERVLKQVQRSRKVLEENLQAVLRARNGETLHSHLEALSNNRDPAEQLRIKRTVDAWISSFSKDIKDEVAGEESLRDLGKDAGTAAIPVQKNRDTVLHRQPRARPLRGHPAAAKAKPQQLRQHQARTEKQSKQEDEDYLAKIYGKALYEGHRRTLKKGPYLRFNSPSPKNKAPRPKVIESVKGVKMKSSKTQTSLFPAPPTSTAQARVPPEPQFLFSPSAPAGQQDPASPLQGYLIPMAIPLGQPRVDGHAPQPSRVIISNRPVTVTTSYTPKVDPAPCKPNVLLLEVKSDHGKRHPPQLQVQVQPSINIDSFSSSNAIISPHPTLPPPNIQTAGGVQEQLEEEEESGFPGTHFLAVADITQESEADSHLRHAPIELNGLPSPPATLYLGPAFPPQPPEPAPLTEPILSTIRQRETMENRLVDWVEQQLMARVITEMYSLHIQTDPASHSEPEDSVASDIVEAAGGGGVQLFVDAGAPVDSALIRQCVDEALAETIAVMLGQRAEQHEPIAPNSQTNAQQEPVVPTPVPTPEPSLRPSPKPLSRGQSPVHTPESSEQSSPVQPPRDTQTSDPQPAPPVVEHSPVPTPYVTPVPSPPRVPTPSPELSQKEEELQSEKEEPLQPRPVIMPGLKEGHTPVPPSPPLISRPEIPPALPPALSPSLTEESSSTVPISDTDFPGTQISDGELLLSKIGSDRALQGHTLVQPNLNISFSSSLHGVLDMDDDPSSEGQVAPLPSVHSYHESILTLLSRNEEAPLIQDPSQFERSSEDDCSAGEQSEGQRPNMAGIEESLLTKHSLLERPGGQELSPGESAILIEDSPSRYPQTQLGTQSAAPPPPHRAPTSTHQSPHQEQADESAVGAVNRPVPIMVRQYEERTHVEKEKSESHFQISHDDTEGFFEDKPNGASVLARDGQSSTMAIHLPSTQPEERSDSISTLEGDADSSINEIF